ncbi:hypothetical protein ACUN90_04020, partial [Escherichia sp. SP-MK2]
MSRNTEATDDVKTWTGGPLNYKEGFFTQLATDELAKGINEEVVRDRRLDETPASTPAHYASPKLRAPP